MGFAATTTSLISAPTCLTLTLRLSASTASKSDSDLLASLKYLASGAIAYYLAHEQEIDSYLERSEREAEAQGAEINARARAVRPELFERLGRTRQERETAPR